MLEWSNPHTSLQKSFRLAIKNTLRRTNGTVSPGQVRCCLRSKDPNKRRLVVQRLFSELTPMVLEWKSGLADARVVEQRVKGNKAVDLTRLLDLHRTSRRLEQRTRFPNIAPTNRRTQLVSRFGFHAAPVFGVDILIRPPVAFSAGPKPRNSLHVGSEQLAFVIHGNFGRRKLICDEQFCTRLVFGSDFAIPRMVPLISEAAEACEAVAKNYLTEGDVASATAAILRHLDDFASKAASAFVS